MSVKPSVVDNLSITYVQSDIIWEDKQANFNELEGLLKEVEETDLIILPEMFNTGFTYNKSLAESTQGPTADWMKKIAVTKQAFVCGSYLVSEDGKFYNRFVGVYPDGRLVKYDKAHLFRITQESEELTPGEFRVIFKYKGWKICPVICYDIRFPLWCRNQVNKEQLDYDLLIAVASWPNKRIQAWDKLLPARAIENQAYVVGVNRVGRDGYRLDYTGHSQLISFTGDQMAFSDHNEEVVTQLISRKEMVDFRAEYPFYLDADPFIREQKPKKKKKSFYGL